MKIGKAIKKLREEKGISQNKLSEITGLDRSYLYKVENDVVSPMVDTLDKIAEGIGIKVSEIFIEADKE